MTREEALKIWKDSEESNEVECKRSEVKEAIQVAFEMLQESVEGTSVGAWKKVIVPDASWDRIRFYCPACGQWQTYGESKYCPNCGARVDKSKKVE